ncbi:MAG: hypothetical protein ABSD98_02440 [Candidatus Korobacteraceae bacterium]|jgi:hypothetical protein
MTVQQIATYKAALKEARIAFDKTTKRLAEISVEANALKGEVTRLRQTITALAALCSESPGFDEFGITDACIEVMENISGTISSAGVVKWLNSMGFEIASQKNVAASVHAVLTRLANKGKITKIVDKDGKNVIGWRGPNYDPEMDSVLDRCGITEEVPV